MSEAVRYTDPATGEEYRRYMYEYHHNGHPCGFDVWATSKEDADERISKMQFATYDGVMEGCIPVADGPTRGISRFIGWVRVSLLCWWKNICRRM